MRAGVASACVSTPADVIKTRLMNSAGGTSEYAGVVDAFRSILRREGPLALYKGFLPIVVRKAPRRTSPATPHSPHNPPYSRKDASWQVLWCSMFFASYECD